MYYAEYEFGTIPASLRRICSNYDDYSYVYVDNVKNKLGEPLIVYTKNTEKDVLPYTFSTLFISGSRNETKGKNYALEYMSAENVSECIIDFWWDIDNDAFAFFGDVKKELINIAIKQMRIKWDMVQTKKPTLFEKLFKKHS